MYLSLFGDGWQDYYAIINQYLPQLTIIKHYI